MTFLSFYISFFVLWVRTNQIEPNLLNSFKSHDVSRDHRIIICHLFYIEIMVIRDYQPNNNNINIT